MMWYVVVIGSAVVTLGGVAVMAVYYEIRRKRRIEAGLPVDDSEDVKPRGFEVEWRAGEGEEPNG